MDEPTNRRRVVAAVFAEGIGRVARPQRVVEELPKKRQGLRRMKEPVCYT